MSSECHGSTRHAKTVLFLLTFRESHPWDCTFNVMLCFLFQSTFFLLVPPPSGLPLTCVFAREAGLHLLSCLQCGFTSESLWSLSQNRHKLWWLVIMLFSEIFHIKDSSSSSKRIPAFTKYFVTSEGCKMLYVRYGGRRLRGLENNIFRETN